MIEQSADFSPIWMLLSAVFGFLIGEAYGDQARHRKCLEDFGCAVLWYRAGAVS